jgi:hypothetical protein
MSESPVDLSAEEVGALRGLHALDAALLEVSN